MRIVDGAVRLVCPKCAHVGTANWLPGYAGTRDALSDLSAGFVSIDTGTQDGPRIVCQTCRIRADEQSPS
jgi:hypothetical protein